MLCDCFVFVLVFVCVVSVCFKSMGGEEDVKDFRRSGKANRVS